MIGTSYMKTITKDKGAKRIIKELKKASKEPYVTVGVHEGADPYKSKSGDVPVTLVAAVHEFGTNRAGRNRNTVIPERAPLRKTWNKEFKNWLKVTKELKDSILRGKLTVTKALDRIGFKMTADIKNAFDAYDKLFPGNKSQKIGAGLKRQSEGGKLGEVMKTLYRTGHLKDSITYEVHEK